MVWKAFDTQLERAVAPKILTERLTADTARLDRFAREARTLAELLPPEGLPFSRFLEIAEAVAAAIAAAEAQGSVRKAGQRVRITTELTDVAEGFVLWSERFDRELSDIFAVQDEIAESVVQALQVSLSPRERRAVRSVATVDAQAHVAHGMALSLFERSDEAVAEFERALALDPRSYDAHNFYAHGARMRGEKEKTAWSGRGARRAERRLDLGQLEERVLHRAGVADQLPEADDLHRLADHVAGADDDEPARVRVHEVVDRGDDAQAAAVAELQRLEVQHDVPHAVLDRRADRLEQLVALAIAGQAPAQGVDAGLAALDARRGVAEQWPLGHAPPPRLAPAQPAMRSRRPILAGATRADNARMPPPGEPRRDPTGAARAVAR